VSITENEVKGAILKWLLDKKVMAWRNNTGAFAGSYKGRQRFFRYGVLGSGDIFALHRGVFISIETKAPGKKPNEDQEAWMERVRHHGGAASWFDNIDEFIEWWEATFPREGGVNVLR
jgi:hypothetical protein